MTAWPDLYTEFQRTIRRDAATTLQTDFTHFVNECDRDIQNVARVEKVWSVTIVADTQSYTLASASITDLYRPIEGKFLATGTTDELQNYDDWVVIPIWDDSGAEPGFYIAASTIYVPVVPTSAGTLKIRGYKTLAAITSSQMNTGGVTTPEINARFHDIFVFYAAMRFGAQRTDFRGDGRYANFRAEYEQKKRDLGNFTGATKSSPFLMKQKPLW